MVAEALLTSEQISSLKSRFSSISSNLFATSANIPAVPSSSQSPTASCTSSQSPQIPLSDVVSASSVDFSLVNANDVFNQRKQREFIPDNKKDESYWDRRRRNNEAAKRSREKRRFNDMVLESRVVELTKENCLLRAQLNAIREKFGIIGENLIDEDQVLSQLPAIDNVVSASRRGRPTSDSMNLPHGVVNESSNLKSLVRSTCSSPSGVVALPVSARNPALIRQQSLQVDGADRTSNILPDFCRSLAVDTEYLRSSGHFLGIGDTAVNLSKSQHGSISQELMPMTVGDFSFLPLKLRHKSRLSDRENGCVEPKMEPSESPSSPSSSADERDSGISDRSASSDGSDEPERKRRREFQYQQSSDSLGEVTATCTLPLSLQSTLTPAASVVPSLQLPHKNHIQSELERLAMEVASLKSLFNSNQLPQ